MTYDFLSEPRLVDALDQGIEPSTESDLRTLVGAEGIRLLLSYGLLSGSGVKRLETTERGYDFALFARYFEREVAREDLSTRFGPESPGVSLVANASESLLRRLSSIASIGSLYLCSPWIRIPEGQREQMKRVLRKTTDRVIVMFRPLKETSDLRIREGVRDSLEWIKSNTRCPAMFVEVPNLHAKVYLCISPQSSRDVPYYTEFALIGSENLTFAENVELAVLVDGRRNDLIDRIRWSHLDRIQREGRLWQQ